MPIYTLCGDNIDKIIRRRYLRCDSNATATSLHYFHFYAVKDRIHFGDLGERPIVCDGADQLQLALSLLPSPEDDVAIRRNICVLISRILYNNLGFFKVHGLRWRSGLAYRALILQGDVDEVRCGELLM